MRTRHQARGKAKNLCRGEMECVVQGILEAKVGERGFIATLPFHPPHLTSPYHPTPSTLCFRSSDSASPFSSPSSCARSPEACDGCGVDTLHAVEILSFLLTLWCGPAPLRIPAVERVCRRVSSVLLIYQPSPAISFTHNSLLPISSSSPSST